MPEHALVTSTGSMTKLCGGAKSAGLGRDQIASENIEACDNQTLLE